MKQINSTKNSLVRKTTPSPIIGVAGGKMVVRKKGRVKVALKKSGAGPFIHYVLPLGNGWVIKSSKAATFTAITDSKTEAISIARIMARTNQSELVVHGKNGVIEIRESYAA